MNRYFTLIPSIFTRDYTQTIYFLSIRTKLYLQKVKCQISMLYRSHKAKIMLYLQVIPCTEAKESLDLINKKLRPHKTAMVLKICEYIISFNQYP